MADKYLEMGMYAPPGTPNYRFVDPDGKVSRHALEQSGIGLGKLRAIQKVIDRVWRAETQAMQNRMINDEDKGANHYLIPSVPGRSEAIQARLEQDLADILGPADARKLMSALQPTALFGWFGKYDVELEVRETGGKTQIRYQCYYPENGKAMRGGSGPPDAGAGRLMFGPGFKFK